jgi:hypothetical protein
LVHHVCNVDLDDITDLDDGYLHDLVALNAYDIACMPKPKK